MDLSTLIAAAHDRIRRYVKAMPADQRSALFDLLPTGRTHLYAWLRGANHQIGVLSLDMICRKLGIKLKLQDATPNGRVRKVKVFRKPVRRIDWSQADWSKPVSQVARDVECTLATAYDYAKNHNIAIQRQKPGRPRKVSSP
jgi:hypothetical protein